MEFIGAISTAVFTVILPRVRTFANHINEALANFEPVEIIIITIASLIILNYLFQMYAYLRKNGLVVLAFRLFTKLPIVRGKLAQ